MASSSNQRKVAPDIADYTIKMPREFQSLEIGPRSFPNPQVIFFREGDARRVQIQYKVRQWQEIIVIDADNLTLHQVRKSAGFKVNVNECNFIGGPIQAIIAHGNLAINCNVWFSHIWHKRLDEIRFQFPNLRIVSPDGVSKFEEYDKSKNYISPTSLNYVRSEPTFKITMFSGKAERKAKEVVPVIRDPNLSSALAITPDHPEYQALAQCFLRTENQDWSAELKAAAAAATAPIAKINIMSKLPQTILKSLRKTEVELLTQYFCSMGDKDWNIDIKLKSPEKMRTKLQNSKARVDSLEESSTSPCSLPDIVQENDGPQLMDNSSSLTAGSALADLMALDFNTPPSEDAAPSSTGFSFFDLNL